MDFEKLIEFDFGVETFKLFDKNNNLIFLKNSDGSWKRFLYNDDGKIIYSAFSDNFWERYEYDKHGNQIYYENSYDYWEMINYDDDGEKEIYFENSAGFVKYDIGGENEFSRNIQS